MEHFGSSYCRYGRDYYINDVKTSSGNQRSHHIYGDSEKSFGAHHIDQDYNNNKNSKRINSATSGGGDDDDGTDSVSDLEIIFNRKQTRNAVTLAQKWPPADMLLKRSMSLCSVRSYANKAINGNDRNMHANIYSTHNGIRSSNCSLDQLTPAKSIGQIEEQALHSDIRRCSFRSRNGTNNFVVNPLFDEYGTEF